LCKNNLLKLNKTSVGQAGYVTYLRSMDQGDVLLMDQDELVTYSWNLRFDETVKQYGFIKNEDEPCVYKKVSGSMIVFLVLYVDDILLIGIDIPTLQQVKSWLGKCFSMKDLGEAAYILGIRIYRDRSQNCLSQSTYIDKVLRRFNMNDSNLVMCFA